jgi:hypothetical protein
LVIVMTAQREWLDRVFEEHPRGEWYLDPKLRQQVFAAMDASDAEHEARMREYERAEQERKHGPSLETLQRMAREHELMMIRMESDPAYIRCAQENRRLAIERLRWQSDTHPEPEERKRILKKMVRMSKEYARDVTRCMTQQACECGDPSCEKCGGGS